MTGTYRVRPKEAYIPPAVKAPLTFDCNGVIFHTGDFIGTEIGRIFKDEIAASKQPYDSNLHCTDYMFGEGRHAGAKPFLHEAHRDRYLDARIAIKEDPSIVRQYKMFPGAQRGLPTVLSWVPVAFVSRSTPAAMENVWQAFRRYGIRVLPHTLYGNALDKKDRPLRDIGALIHVDNERTALNSPLAVQHFVVLEEVPERLVSPNMVIFPGGWDDPQSGARLEDVLHTLLPPHIRRQGKN